MQREKYINIACWNTRGFNTAIPYLRELVDNNDIVAVAEHWLHECKLSRLEEISDKIVFCGRSSKFASDENYGAKRGQGGVALLWKQDMVGVTVISNIIHDRICGIRVPTAECGVLNIYAVYLPAKGCGEDLETCIDDLAEILESSEQGAQNILCGDFNADVGRLGGCRSNRAPTKQGIALIKLVKEFGLHICNLSPSSTGPIDTYIGPTGRSTIDYFMVPHEMSGRVKVCKVLSNEVLNTSDHSPIQVTINVENFKSAPADKIGAGMKRWDKLNSGDIQAKYTDPLTGCTKHILDRLKQAVNESDLDGCIDELTNKIHEAAKGIPTSRFRKHLKPFWSERMDELKKDKVLTYNAWKSEGRPRIAGHPLWERYKDAKKCFQKELKRLGKGYEDEQIAQAVKAAEVDRGQFWKLVKKSRKGAGNRIAAIKDIRGKVISDTDGILNVWKEHFRNLYTPKDNPDFDNEHH